MNLMLHEKLEKAREIIKEAMQKFAQDEICVAWTGGKDSTTMLWLYRQVCEELAKPLCKVMFIDEGDTFLEILEFVDWLRQQWNIDLVVVRNSDVSEKARKIGDFIRVAELDKRNRAEIEKLGFSEEGFAFDPESYVGNHLMKTVAMQVFMQENNIKALNTAIRWDEQEARKEEEYFSARTDPDHTRVQPMLHFSERDIWNTIRKYDIPYCSLYERGYRSLGTKSATVRNSDIPAWEQDLENTPERAARDQDKEEIMAQLRSLGYM
jgi:phosphoadenosine phosphosulfate reductase